MKNVFILFLLFLGLKGSAQSAASFHQLRAYGGDIVDAAFDKLDNLYLVSSTGQVRKYNDNGDSLGVFSGVRNYGKLQAMDVTNPLKPLLFYKAFSTVVVLDRFLALRTAVDLRRSSILQPGAIGLAYDNNIWVFDEYDNKLKKVDEQGTLLLETPDFRNLFAEAVRPQLILNDNGLVYLADTASGVYIFDNYGSFQKRVAVKGWQGLLVREGHLVQTGSSRLTVLNLKTYQEKQQPLPSFTPYRRAFATTSRLATLSVDSLRVYRY